PTWRGNGATPLPRRRCAACAPTPPRPGALWGRCTRSPPPSGAPDCPEGSTRPPPKCTSAWQPSKTTPSRLPSSRCWRHCSRASEMYHQRGPAYPACGRGAVLKQRCDLTREPGEEWRGEGIRRIQGRDETQGELLALVDFDLLGTPVHNPVFQHTAARVELEFGLTITALISSTWRQHFDY